ncbi:MAG TPA: peptide deformylase [Paludibaculum sp.]|jgi:peptide deformylase
MAVRRILQLGDPALRQVSAPVDHPAGVSDLLADLSDTLAAFRRTHGFGRGISAIQIGNAHRVIFLHVDGKPFELINPHYLERSQETFELWDDCFSFPNLMVRLRRHTAIRLRYQDRSGAWTELAARDAFAELIQHEMDHLDGVLAVDRAENSLSLSTREEFLRIKASQE